MERDENQEAGPESGAILYYCVLHRKNNVITVLDAHGKQVREIFRTDAFGKMIEFGVDIHMDSASHNIYVPCNGKNRGVLCLSVEGEPLWVTPLEGYLGGITELDGTLCVSDCCKGHAWCTHGKQEWEIQGKTSRRRRIEENKS